MTLHTKSLTTELSYDGTQLRSHWVYEHCGLLGNALIAGAGPCTVPTTHMVDLEDVRADRPIHSQAMLHYLGEFYQFNLRETILLQRLLISLLQQSLHQRLGTRQLRRRGNDLYDGDFKLSVSIATVSPTSSLIHAGINIDSRNTPIPTRGLADYNIAVEEFAQETLAAFQHEFQSLDRDVAKVRAVS